MRFLLYSHDGMGMGHVHRHLAIASALVERCPDARILLVTSLDEVASLGLPPNVDTLKLPGLRKTGNKQYAARRLGLPSGQIHNFRSAVLQAAVESFQPSIIVADKHPFGVAGEFEPGLLAAKAYGARIVLGLRDILDDTAAVLNEWSADRLQQRVAEFFDLVLVYGEQALFNPIQEYRFPPTLAERTRFCGYVLNRPRYCAHPRPWASLADSEPERPQIVLGTAGGGEDGYNLLETFIGAAQGARWQGVAVTGPMIRKSELERLQNLAKSNCVILHTFIPGLSCLFGEVDAVVSMGGYNTLVEAVARGVPTVCVPRISPRSEQLLRAKAFEEMGLLRMLHPRRLGVETLRTEISAALQMSRAELKACAHSALSFNGAASAVGHLLELVGTTRRDKEGRLVSVAE